MWQVYQQKKYKRAEDKIPLCGLLAMVPCLGDKKKMKKEENLLKMLWIVAEQRRINSMHPRENDEDVRWFEITLYILKFIRTYYSIWWTSISLRKKEKKI